MEQLIGKLVSIEDHIRSSGASGEITDQKYESCRDILNCIITEVRQSRKRAFRSDHKAVGRLQNQLEKSIQTLLKTLRVQKRQRIRSADNRNGSTAISEDALMKLAKDLIDELSFDIVDEEENHNQSIACSILATTTGLPPSVEVYKNRLVKYSKELYKNPPAMPPDPVIVVDTTTNTSDTLVPRPPRRDPKTQRLTFFMSYEECQLKKKNSSSIVVADFHPNVTPDEVLHGGAFGGTYFRNIHSAVTNKHYIGTDVIRDTLAPEWITCYDTKSISTKLTSATYDTKINKFRVKCGGSLGMWESSGWISDVDPYGWFQWYCRFYRGRRSSDDTRQISRWKALAGARGRFKSQLCNKILQKASSMTAASTPSKTMATAINNISISPVVRQTLFHWGLLVTEEVMEQHEISQKR